MQKSFIISLIDLITRIRKVLLKNNCVMIININALHNINNFFNIAHWIILFICLFFIYFYFLGTVYVLLGKMDL